MIDPVKNAFTISGLRALIRKIVGRLSAKVDMTDVVSSWPSTPDDSHVPSVKLVKDTLDNMPPGTAVKGDAESEYRTGNVNITPANIGAYSKAESDNLLSAKENVVNKKQSIDPTSTTEFGSSKAVADFVNSSVATNTANFLGSFTLTDLSLTYPATNVQIAAALNSHTWPTGVTPTNNDYVYVEIQDPQTTGVDDKVERFKFSSLLESWGYEYTLNNSSFTADEMATLESGITASDKTTWNAAVTDLSTHTSNSNIHVTSSDKTAWDAKQNAVNTDTDENAFGDDTTIATGFGSDKVHLNLASRLWTYISGKISSVLGLTASTYGGKSATSGNADDLDSVLLTSSDDLDNIHPDNFTVYRWRTSSIPAHAPYGGSGDATMHVLPIGDECCLQFVATCEISNNGRILEMYRKRYKDGNNYAWTTWAYTDTHQSVTDNNPTLAWGVTSTVGTVGSTNLRLTMPSNPASGKLDTTGNASDTTSTFTKASGDASSMASGSKLSALFTSISSFIASLKALAFKATAEKSDLSQAVQTSLGKADTALQSSNVDSALSTTSTNPVQNKVVAASLNGKAFKFTLPNTSGSSMYIKMGTLAAGSTRANNVSFIVSGIDGIGGNTVDTYLVEYDNRGNQRRVRYTLLSPIPNDSSRWAEFGYKLNQDNTIDVIFKLPPYSYGLLIRLVENDFTFNYQNDVSGEGYVAGERYDVALTSGSYPSMTVGKATRAETIFEGSSNKAGMIVRNVGTTNTDNNYAGWKKFATVSASVGSNTACRICGYIYVRDANWAQAPTYKIRFQIILNFTSQSYRIYHTPSSNVSSLIRIVEVSARSNYEIQINPQGLGDYSFFYAYAWLDATRSEISVSWDTTMAVSGSTGTVVSNQYVLDTYAFRVANGQVGSVSRPVYVKSDGSVAPCNFNTAAYHVSGQGATTLGDSVFTEYNQFIINDTNLRIYAEQLVENICYKFYNYKGNYCQLSFAKRTNDSYTRVWNISTAILSTSSWTDRPSLSKPTSGICIVVRIGGTIYVSGY